MRYDARTDKIRVGGASASVGEIIRAVAAAGNSPDATADLSTAIVVKMTEAEHKGIKIRAAQAGLTIQEYARTLLVLQSLV